VTMTLNANWLAAAAAGTNAPRLLVRIWTATGVSSRYLDGLCQTDYPVSVLSVSQAGRSVDPWTRETSIDNVSVTLRSDDSTDDLVSNNPLKGTRVEVRLGFDVLGEGDFEPLFIGTITDVISTENQYRLPCKSITQYLDSDITGSWGNIHPLEMAEAVALQVGVPSDLINATSMDPTTHVGIEHWVVDRESTALEAGEDHSITSPVKAKAILDSMARHLGGMFAVQEDGTIEYVHYPEAGPGSPVDVWTEDDMAGERPITPKTALGDVVNSVLARGHFVRNKIVGRQSADDEEAQVSFVVDETASQAAFVHASGTASPGLTFAKETKSEWSTGYAWLSDFNAAPAATHPLNGPGVAYLSGARWPGYPAGSHPAATQVSASRPLYLLIDQEIVACDQLNLSTSTRTYVHSYDPTSGWGGTSKQDRPAGYGAATIRVLSRGAFGTSSVNHPGYKQAYDVTPLISAALMRARRWRYGVTILEVKTKLHKYAYQYGDIVGLEMDAGYYTGYKISSLTSAIKWEVVGKHPDISGPEPHIRWTLALAANAAHTAFAATYAVEGRRSLAQQIRRMLAIDLDVFAVSTIYSGFGLSDSGLDVTVGSGFAVNGESIAELPIDATLTMTASVTSWITFDVGAQQLVVRESGSQPSPEGREAWLWKVITDGSGVTSTVDLRVYRQGIVPAIVAASCISPAKVSTISEMSSIVPNGEFTSWSPPLDDQTVYPPDKWLVGTITRNASPPFELQHTETDNWEADDSTNNGTYYDTTPANLLTGDVALEMWVNDGIAAIPGIVSADLFPVTEDHLYVVQAAAYRAIANCQVSVEVQFYAEDKSTLIGFISDGKGAASPAGFEYMQRIGKAPSGSRWARVFALTTKSASGATNAYWDYIRMQRTADAFYAYGQATSTMASAAWTAPAFTLAPVDAYGSSINYGSSYDYSVNRYFTAWRNGLWDFRFKITFSGLATGQQIQLGLWRNGTPATGTLVASETLRNDSAGTISGEVSLGYANIGLATGDNIRPYVYVSGGGAVTLTGGAGAQYLNYFSGQEKKEL